MILDVNDKVVMRLQRNEKTNRLWFINYSIPSTRALYTSIPNSDLAKLWHDCLGHSHPDAVIKFLNVHKNLLLKRRYCLPCDSCAMGKLSQTPATYSFHRSPGVLNVIHSDILGPIHPPTPSGA